MKKTGRKFLMYKASGKYLAMLLVAVLTISLCACGDAGSGSGGAGKESTGGSGAGQGGSGQSGSGGQTSDSTGTEQKEGSLQVVIHSGSEADFIISEADMERGKEGMYSVYFDTPTLGYAVRLMDDTNNGWIGFIEKAEDAEHLSYGGIGGNFSYSLNGDQLVLSVKMSYKEADFSFYDVTEYTLEHRAAGKSQKFAFAADVATGRGNGNAVNLDASLRVIQYRRSNARFIVNGIPDEWGENDSCQIRFDADGGTYCIRLEKNGEKEVCRICFKSVGSGVGEETELDYGRCEMTFLPAEGKERVIDMNFWENDICLDDVESFTLQYLQNNGYDEQTEKVFAAADVVEYPVLVCDGYKDDGNGGIIITRLKRPEGYQDSDSVIYAVIPNTVDGKPVTVIGDGNEYEFVFAPDNGDYERVLIPDSVVEIGNDGFRGVPVTSIQFPEGLRRIGAHAFAGAPLKSITIPVSVTEIGERAFEQCEELENITILGGNAVLGESVFEYGKNLKSVNIDAKTIGPWLFVNNESVFSATIKAETIEEYAFSSCGMTDATVSVDVVENNAFEWCGQLTNINFEKVRLIGDTAFYFCGELTTISFPEGLEFIESTYPRATFEGCEKLTGVTFPKSLKQLGTGTSGTFYNCYALGDVVFLGDTKIAKFTFPHCFDVRVTYNGSTYDYSTVESIYTE